jgi:hypothetical protein
LASGLLLWPHHLPCGVIPTGAVFQAKGGISRAVESNPGVLSVEKFNVFSSAFQFELIFFCETQKNATNSNELFIISSFTANSGNQWVVFFSPYLISIQPTADDPPGLLSQIY